MFAYFQHYRAKPSKRNCHRSGERPQFRGHIERLESRTVLSASFGSPHSLASTPDAVELFGGYSSHEVVAHKLADTSVNSFRFSGLTDAHNSERNQPERFDSARSDALNVVTLDIFNAPKQAPSNQFSDQAASVSAPLNLDTIAAFTSPIESGTAPAFARAAVTDPRFVTSPLAGVYSLELSSISLENVAGTTIVNSEAFVARDTSVSNDSLPLTAGPTTFDLLQSNLATDSEEAESERLRFRLIDNLSSPLDALKREQAAIDEVLFRLIDVPESHDESTRKTEKLDRTSEESEKSSATELAEHNRQEPLSEQSDAEGGLVLLQAEGDPNLDARDLVAIITSGDKNESAWESGLELAVGTYLQIEIGEQPAHVASPSASPVPRTPSLETRASARNGPGGDGHQSS